MKKLILLLVIAFLAIVVRFEAKAQAPPCPPGANLISDQVTVISGNTSCLYDIQYCLLCQPSGGIGDFSLYSFSKHDPHCILNPPLNSTQIYGQIVDIVTVPDYLAQKCNYPGPCDTYPGGIWYQFCFWMCWEKFFDIVNNVVVYVPCWQTSDAECIQIIRVCWDGTQYIRTLESQNQTGTFNCAGQPEPPDPTSQNPGPTSCFPLPTPCNP